MAYTVAPTPWQASGKSGSFEEWTRLRIPNLAPVDRPGSYLDIGCSNGFLLECLLAWAKLKRVALVPFRLDYSQEIVQLARQKLTRYKADIYHGKVYTWAPPQRFDYIRTELAYVPRNYRRPLIERLPAEFVNPDGKLILSDYRSRRDDLSRDCGLSITTWKLKLPAAAMYRWFKPIASISYRGPAGMCPALIAGTWLSRNGGSNMRLYC